MVLAPMLDAVANRRSADGTESLAVSSDPVWMRFDLTGLVGAEGVERAVLSLAPHPRWRPSEAPTARLLVRAAAGVQGATAVSVSEGVESEVTLPASARGPLRVDVTGLVRQWLAGTVPAGTLSLESTRGTAVFMGNGAMTRSERPRLEVVLR